jgi:hypothetical protein
MQLEQIISAGITEESATAWWLKTFAGVDGPIIIGGRTSGRLNKRGTPIFDTNWSPAAALIALKYREMTDYSTSQIAKAVDKSWHAVRDLFAKVDAAAESKSV